MPARHLQPGGLGSRLLIVEDNRSLAANLGEYLSAAGWSVDFAYDGATGLQLASSLPFEAIVLDVALPKLDGLEVCARLREEHGVFVPILMLTARDTLPDKLHGFEAGADDYLTKPFALAELQVRLQALMRRRSERRSVLSLADLVYDTRTLKVERGGTALKLSPTGLRLLECLLRRAPAVVTRNEIEHHLWGDEPPDGDAALRVHVHALRAAIDKPFCRPLLHTQPGVGYSLRVDRDD